MLLALSATTTNAIQGGFQSGPSPGAFYTGGMTYIPKSNGAFLTGSHYNKGLTPHDGTDNDLMQGIDQDTSSSCYLGKVKFDDVVSGAKDTFHTLSDWVSYGNPGAIETCSAVASTHGSDVYVVGSVADGGLFSDGYPMQGLLSIIDSQTLEFIDATLIKSAEDPSTHMIYPLDVIHDNGRKFIYIAALTSTDAIANPLVGNKQEPNWQEQHMLGSSFDVTVIKIHAPNGEKPNAVWVQHFPLDVESDGSRPPVFVAGMALQLDTNGAQHLLISGSTRGSGDAFGKAQPGSMDEDGFVMQLALKDGSFLQHDRHAGKVYNYEDDLREGTESDDFIRGMCNNRDQRGDGASDVFYVVGGSKGDMTTNDQGFQNSDENAGFQFGAGVESKYRDTWDREESLMPFLRQVSILNLKPLWTTQWAAMPGTSSIQGQAVPTNAYAMDCYVDIDKGAIYVVGSVLRGAKMSQGEVEMLNQGGDDVWVAKVDEKTGNVFWLTQLGTMDNEKLARHGSIAVNQEGNVIIYGDTNGSMYRSRGGNENPETTDMFLMTLDGTTGAVMDDYYMGGTSSASVADAINGVPPVATASPQRTQRPMPPTDIDMAPKPGMKSKKENAIPQKTNKAGFVFGIIFGVIGVLVGLFFFFTRQMNKRKADAQKSTIFACLQQFDVEDIDLRRSPPGGWHGTYMNKLAYGHNNADDMAVDSGTGDGALLNTHSSVAGDALFMEDSATPGYRDQFQIDENDDVDTRLDAKVV